MIQTLVRRGYSCALLLATCLIADSAQGIARSREAVHPRLAAHARQAAPTIEAASMPASVPVPLGGRMPAGALDGAAASAPSFVIEPQTGLERFAHELEKTPRSRLAAAARDVPTWAAGYASGPDGIVLIPTRTPSYPDGSLESVLVHEATHIFVARALRGRSVPHWFNEGVAMTAAHEWDVEDRAMLVLELLPWRTVGLADLDALFDEGAGRARRAYTISGSFVGDFVEREGDEAPGRILSLVAQGLSFEEAFARATGLTLGAAEASFWSRQNLWYRWVPLLTSTFTLWTGITLLALWAVKKRREKDARVRERWEAEEEWIAEARKLDPGDPPDRHLVN